VVYEYLRSSDPICNRVRAEFGLVRLVLIGKAFFGSDNPVDEFWFDHPKPADPKHVAEYDRLFDGRVRFDRPHSGFVGPRSILEGKQMYHDDTIVELLRSEADDIPQDLGDEPTLAGRVRHAIVNHYTEVQPTAEAIARKLGTSERSLRRHLNQEGTPFNTVLREALAELAKRILADSTTTIQEAAFRMGFSEPSSFHRAFKRWTGKTPTEYRDDLKKQTNT
jgi:AraC-like DNA-binding protein